MKNKTIHINDTPVDLLHEKVNGPSDPLCYKVTAKVGETEYSEHLVIGAVDQPIPALDLVELQKKLDDHRQKVAAIAHSREAIRLLEEKLE